MAFCGRFSPKQQLGVKAAEIAISRAEGPFEQQTATSTKR
jgi:hypothetical protein